MSERKKEVLSIQGLNTSEPDFSVKDGLCKELNNLRYKEGAWRKVAPYKPIVELYCNPPDVIDNYKIAYKHPAAKDNRYIAYFDEYKGKPNTVVELELSQNKETGKALAKVSFSFGTFLNPEPKINHFGNVLIIQDKEETLYYLLQNNEVYTSYTVPTPPIVKGISRTYTRIVAQFHGTPSIGYYYTLAPDDKVSTSSYVYWRLFNLKENEVLIPVNDGKDNNWFGEIAIFAAFRMIDGTYTSPSLAHIISSESLEDVVVGDLKKGGFGFLGGRIAKNVFNTGDGNSFIELYARNMKPTLPYVPHTRRLLRVKPTITIDYDVNLKNSQMLDALVIFSTRVHPIYDYLGMGRGKFQDKLIDPIQTPINMVELYSENKLIDQPFYLLETFLLEENLNSVTIELGYDKLKDIEHKPLYKPSQTLHKIHANVYHEYNGKAHFADIKTDFFKGYATSAFLNSSANRESYRRWHLKTTLTANNHKFEIYDTSPDGYGYPTTLTTADKTEIFCLTYPDYRASEMVFLTSDLQNNPTTISLPLRLKPAVANNFAYYLPTSSPDNKYPPIERMRSQAFPSLYPITENNKFYEPNRLQVSELNNIFSLPMDSSFKIGSDDKKIVAINSVAEQLSDAKFGEFPLYAFTQEGVWALQSGNNEIIYSNIIPINRDIVRNPNTISSSYNVFYVTSQGLRAISGKNAQLVSTPINNEFAQVNMEFLSTAELFFTHTNNELIIYNSKFPRAYIYSLSSNVWSTRDFSGRKINSNEVVVGNVICSSEDEDNNQQVYCTLTTRAIKFGSLEFKRLETLIPRFAYLGDCTEECSEAGFLQLNGSADLKQWKKLRELSFDIRGNIVLRRTALSAKLYALTLSFVVKGGMAITHFDVEVYHRHLRKLR